MEPTNKMDGGNTPHSLLGMLMCFTNGIFLEISYEGIVKGGEVVIYHVYVEGSDESLSISSTHALYVPLTNAILTLPAELNQQEMAEMLRGKMQSLDGVQVLDKNTDRVLN